MQLLGNCCVLQRSKIASQALFIMIVTPAKPALMVNKISKKNSVMRKESCNLKVVKFCSSAIFFLLHLNSIPAFRNHEADVWILLCTNQVNAIAYRFVLLQRQSGHSSQWKKNITM